MKRILPKFLLATLFFAAANANAYYVRPYLQLGGGSVDGLIQNGATSASQNFTSSLRAGADLNTGKARALVDLTGTNQFGQAVGGFGDTVSFSNNSVGTSVNFSFLFDGTMDVTNVVNQGAFMQYGYQATLYVFEAGSGATYANYTSIGGELIGRSKFASFTNPETDVSTVVNDILSQSITISDVQDFDVFASLGVFTSTGNNPVRVKLDFLNTGSFGIQTADGVTYTSQSGVFLDSTNPSTVPVPGTLALLGIGLLGIAGRRRTVSAG
ncbi:Uncharacterised protein [Halioglobus japonicus]|nr:Uncharacterised protein [Halioglobus japonicus]